MAAQELKLKVKTLQPATYELNISAQATVLQLKERLVSVAGIPLDRQRLIFRGAVLENEQLLTSRLIEDGHTLHLVERPDDVPQAPPDAGEQWGNVHHHVHFGTMEIGMGPLGGGFGAISNPLQGLGQGFNPTANIQVINHPPQVVGQAGAQQTFHVVQVTENGASPVGQWPHQLQALNSFLLYLEEGPQPTSLPPFSLVSNTGQVQAEEQRFLQAARDALHGVDLPEELQAFLQAVRVTDRSQAAAESTQEASAGSPAGQPQQPSEPSSRSGQPQSTGEHQRSTGAAARSDAQARDPRRNGMDGPQARARPVTLAPDMLRLASLAIGQVARQAVVHLQATTLPQMAEATNSLRQAVTEDSATGPTVADLAHRLSNQAYNTGALLLELSLAAANLAHAANGNAAPLLAAQTGFLSPDGDRAYITNRVRTPMPLIMPGMGPPGGGASAQRQAQAAAAPGSARNPVHGARAPPAAGTAPGRFQPPQRSQGAAQGGPPGAQSAPPSGPRAVNGASARPQNPAAAGPRRPSPNPSGQEVPTQVNMESAEQANRRGPLRPRIAAERLDAHGMDISSPRAHALYSALMDPESSRRRTNIPVRLPDGSTFELDFSSVINCLENFILSTPTEVLERLTDAARAAASPAGPATDPLNANQQRQPSTRQTSAQRRYLYYNLAQPILQAAFDSAQGFFQQIYRVPSQSPSPEQAQQAAVRVGRTASARAVPSLTHPLANIPDPMRIPGMQYRGPQTRSSPGYGAPGGFQGVISLEGSVEELQDWLGGHPHAAPGGAPRQGAAAGAQRLPAAGTRPEPASSAQGQAPSTATVGAAAGASNASPYLHPSQMTPRQLLAISAVTTSTAPSGTPGQQAAAEAPRAAAVEPSEPAGPSHRLPNAARRAGPEAPSSAARKPTSPGERGPSPSTAAKAGTSEGLALKPGFFKHTCSEQRPDPASSSKSTSEARAAAGSSSTEGGERKRTETAVAKGKGPAGEEGAAVAPKARGLGGGLLSLPARKGPKRPGQDSRAGPAGRPQDTSPAAPLQSQTGSAEASSHAVGASAGQQGAAGRGQAAGAPADLGALLSGLMGGGNQGSGAGNGAGLMSMMSQMIQSPQMQQMFQSPAVQQMANSPAMAQFSDALVGPARAGAPAQQGGQDAPPDFRAMMQQMMPMVQQVVGGGEARGRQGRNPGGGTASSVPERDLSELEELPEQDAQRWRAVILADRKKQKSLERQKKPLSQAYLAGSPGGQAAAAASKVEEEGSDDDLD